MTTSDSNAGLDSERIQAELRTHRYGRSLQLLESTTSTNDDARRAAVAGVPSGHVVCAEQQTEGRGSHGRTWSCAPGTDLYVSIVDRPALSLPDLPPLTLAVGLGVADLVAALCPDARVEVKWPNDVWLEGKKCAGILVEASTMADTLSALVIGIGLNVNRTTFDPSAGGRATSLRLAAGHGFERNEVLAAMLLAVESWTQQLQQRGATAISHALQPRLAMRGQVVQCDSVRGELLGVADNGALRIRTAYGEQQVISGRLQEESHA